MAELREDTPEPPASGSGTQAEDSRWLPPELRREDSDRRVDEPAAPSRQESFGAPPPTPEESTAAPPSPPTPEESFIAPPPATPEASFSAAPPSHPPVSQPPVYEPAIPVPAPAPAPRRIQWPHIRRPRMRKASLPSRSRPPGAKLRGVAVAIVGMIIVGAVGFAIGVASEGEKSDSSAGAASEGEKSDSSGAASKSQKSDSSPPAISRQLLTPFTFESARFEVQPANDKGWAEEMRSTEGEQDGKRWVATAVSIRNLDRARLRPRSLGYRIITPSGYVIGPEVIALDRSAGGPVRRLAKGGRTSVRLGFRVPQDSHDLTLAFDAGGIRQPAVRVLLGLEG